MSKLAALPKNVFSQVIELVLELHRLSLEGKGNSSDALAVSSAMEMPWHSLTEEQQELVSGLSEDLYGLEKGEVKQGVLSAEARRVWARQAQEVFVRYQHGDYVPVLALLRGQLPSDVPMAAVRFLQARCWGKLGELEVALLFMKEAERLDPSFAVDVLTLLRQTKRRTEALQFAERLLNAEASSPAVIYFAAGTLLADTQAMDRGQALLLIQRLTPVLERAFQKCLATRLQEREVPELVAGIASMLGLCLEQLGESERARAVYDEGLNQHPHDNILLTFRALAVYDTAPSEALRDFGLAMQNGATMIWPYLFLAHAALGRADYHACWQYCLKGLVCDAPPQLHVLLHEWLGISQSMLGQPAALVLENFDRAMSLDPANARLRRNRAIAESRLGRSPTKPSNWGIDAAANLVTSLRSRYPIASPERWEEYSILRNDKVTECLLAG